MSYGWQRARDAFYADDEEDAELVERRTYREEAEVLEVVINRPAGASLGLILTGYDEENYVQIEEVSSGGMG